MSWFSQFAESFLNGAVGAPAAVAPTHPNQAPLTNALNAVNQAGAAIGSALTTSAVTTVDTYLETAIGPLGTDMVDVGLQALIAEATSRLSPTATASGAASTAVAAGTAKAATT